MKKVLVLTTVITLIGASHRCYGMEEEAAFTRKFDITPLLSPQQIRESQEQILDSVNSQESDCIKKFDAISPLSPDQILEAQEYSLLNEDTHIKGRLNAITRDLQQTELLLLDAQKKDLPQKEHHALLITTYNCLEKIRKQFGCEDTRKLSITNTILRTLLSNQLKAQAQELELLAEEINNVSLAELKKQ